MTTLTYKNHRIETQLTEDHQPVYICLIDGVYYTNGVQDENEDKTIENAKAEIDRQIQYSK